MQKEFLHEHKHDFAKSNLLRFNPQTLDFRKQLVPSFCLYG